MGFGHIKFFLRSNQTISVGIDGNMEWEICREIWNGKYGMGNMEWEIWDGTIQVIGDIECIYIFFIIIKINIYVRVVGLE